MTARPRSTVRARWIAAGAAAVVVALAAALVPKLVDGSPGSPAPRTTHGTGGDTAARYPVVSRLGGAEELRATAVAGDRIDGSDTAALSAAEQQFALDLLRRSATANTDVTVSPASLALALSMLEHGARGDTARQIADALHTGSMSAARQGAAWHALTADWHQAATGDGPTLDTANSLWQQHGMALQAPFMQALARYYDTGVWQVDFAHDLPGALDAINRWTSASTHGRITQLFTPGSLDPATRLVLADAVYFKAAWAMPFEASDTHDGTFTRADGSTTTASFMHATLFAPSAVTKDYTAVELPYRGDRFAALAIMPTQGSLAGFTAGLSAERLQAIVAGLHGGRATLAMPRFETSSTLDLNGTLQALGIRDAFTRQADLSGIAPDLVVQQVVQRTYLKVAEKGTEAAAATGIGIGITAVAPVRTVVNLDHPFLFFVRDTKTGALLFASQVQDPSS